MSQWALRIYMQDGKYDYELFDHDELGTLDDRVTQLFMIDLEGIKSISITRVPPVELIEV